MECWKDSWNMTSMNERNNIDLWLKAAFFPAWWPLASRGRRIYIYIYIYGWMPFPALCLFSILMGTWEHTVWKSLKDKHLQDTMIKHIPESHTTQMNTILSIYHKYHIPQVLSACKPAYKPIWDSLPAIRGSQPASPPKTKNPLEITKKTKKNKKT